MKRIILLLICVLTFPAISYSQIKSGILIGGMDSWMHKSKTFGETGTQEKDGRWKHRFGFNIGYQFEFDVKKDLFIDAALLYQGRRFNMNYTSQNGTITDKTKLFNSIAINGVVGYRPWKGIRVGIGVEPVLYLNTDMDYNLEKNKFDIPLICKIGYDFKIFQIDLAYKNGFERIYRNYMVGNTATRDLQLSLFIPIFK